MPLPLARQEEPGIRLRERVNHLDKPGSGRGDQARFLKRQLSLPVSTISQ